MARFHPLSAALRACERPCERRRIEDLQVADAFADADKVNGKLKSVGQRNQNSTFCRAVQLGHDEPGQGHCRLKRFHLGDRVLPRRRIEHKQRGVGRRRNPTFSERAQPFAVPPSGPLCSAIVPRCRSAARPCRRSSLFRALRTRGPAASAPGARAITCAPARSPQILSCSIAAARNVSPAASVTRRPSRDELRRELADRRRLAGTVHAGHQHDKRLSCGIHHKGPRRGLHHTSDGGREVLADFRFGNLRVVTAFGNLCRKPPRQIRAQIRTDQRLLQHLRSFRRRGASWSTDRSARSTKRSPCGSNPPSAARTCPTSRDLRRCSCCCRRCFRCRRGQDTAVQIPLIAIDDARGNHVTGY